MMHLSAEILSFIHEHRYDDVRTLALQAKKYPLIDLPFAVKQIAGRQSVQHKIPTWYANDYIVYPTHLSLEQCSSEATACYKAGLLNGNTLVDLTGGFGVDCAFLSTGFQQATYIEQHPELCAIATHNFNALGLHHITVCNCDSLRALQEMPPADVIFVDPARRNQHGGKTILVSDCEPNVEVLELSLLSKARQVMIKLSPMLDVTLALRSLPHTHEVHIVSVQNECKELLLILHQRCPSKVEKDIRIHCVNLTNNGVQHFEFTPAEEVSTNAQFTHKVETYLYEPNASLLKAGAFRTVSSRFGLKKLHPNSHLYTSHQRIEDFPGRHFNVVAVGNVKDKSICCGLTQANITVRNYPLSVAELRKQIKLNDGGDTYLFATTLENGKKVLIRCNQ